MIPISQLKNDLLEEARRKTLKLIDEEVIETYENVPEQDKIDATIRKSS
jgi:hypothetical protein